MAIIMCREELFFYVGAKVRYRKVASSRLFRLVAHLRIKRLFMKGKFDAYVL